MSEPIPVAEPDALTQPWWDATRDETLLVQRCRACGNHQHYPRALCTACHSTDLEYVTAAGRGEVYSYTVIHRAHHPAFTPPHVVALVRLAEGPVLLTNIVGCDPDGIRCDMNVTITWQSLRDGRKLPQFTPVEAKET